MVIDAHAYLDSSASAASAAEAMHAYVQACGVDALLVANRPTLADGTARPDWDETEANLTCLTVCRACRNLFPLYWARPGRFDSHAYAFAGALSSEPFAGAILDPAHGEADPEQAVNLLSPYLGVLASLRLPAVLRTSVGREIPIETVVTLARRYPNVGLVVTAAGRGRGWTNTIDEIQRFMGRGDARLSVDVAQARPDDIVRATGELGAERLLFGTAGTLLDMPHAARCRELLEDLRRRLSPQKFALVAGGNAAQLFGLTEEGRRG